MIKEVSLLIEKYKALDEAAAQMKPEFEAWIKDLEHPLALRWDLWVAAPTSLKNKEEWVQDFYFGDNELEWMESPMYAERREIVLLDDLVERFESRGYKPYYVEGLSDEEYDSSLNMLKETILRKNLYSFTYDW